MGKFFLHSKMQVCVVLFCTLIFSCAQNSKYYIREKIDKYDTIIAPGVKFSGYWSQLNFDSTASIQDVRVDKKFEHISLNLGCCKCELPEFRGDSIAYLALYNSNAKGNTCKFDSLLWSRYPNLKIGILRMIGFDCTKYTNFHYLRNLKIGDLQFVTCKLTDTQIDELVAMESITALGLEYMGLDSVPKSVRTRTNFVIDVSNNSISRFNVSDIIESNTYVLHDNPLDSATVKWIQDRDNIYARPFKYPK